MQDKVLKGSQSTFQEVLKKSVEAIKEAYVKIGVVPRRGCWILTSSMMVVGKREAILHTMVWEH